MLNNRIICRLSAIAIFAALVVMFSFNEKQSGLAIVLNRIESASSLREKDYQARTGLDQLPESDISKLAAKVPLTEAEQVLLLAAYTRGRNNLRSRVDETGRGSGAIAQYARSILRSRSVASTTAK